MKQRKNFAYYTWVVLIFTLLVILWGAYVRATGSGAGCGAHWPTCNGQVIPRPEQTETIIEFTHRISSALSGLLVLIMLVWAFRLYPKGHLVRKGVGFSMLFMITEGAVGAGLVLFELVAYNASAARAMSGAVHLVNTFLLVAAITLTAWWATRETPLHVRGQGSINWLLAIGFLGMLLLGASGAVAALGNMIFPSESVAAGIQEDFSPTAHFLIRLRIWHPTIAIGLGLYLVLVSSAIYTMRPSADTRLFSRALKVLFIVQLGAGALNVFLLAPVWLQLMHLLLADAVWIVLVLLAASAWAQPVPAAEANPLAAQSGD